MGWNTVSKQRGEDTSGPAVSSADASQRKNPARGFDRFQLDRSSIARSLFAGIEGARACCSDPCSFYLCATIEQHFTIPQRSLNLPRDWLPSCAFFVRFTFLPFYFVSIATRAGDKIGWPGTLIFFIHASSIYICIHTPIPIHIPITQSMTPPTWTRRQRHPPGSPSSSRG